MDDIHLKKFSTVNSHDFNKSATWRMYMKEVWFKLDVQLRRDGEISGRLAKRNFSSLAASYLAADDQRVMRTAASIRADLAECFCLVFVAGGTFFYRQRGKEAVARRGDVYLLNAQEAYEVDLTDSPDMLCLTIPADLLRARIKHVDDLCAREQFANRSMAFALGRLVAGALWDPGIGDPIQLQDLCMTMTEMLLTGPHDRPGVHDFPYAPRNAPLVVAEARNILERRFADCDLTVHRLARDCGVSARLLQHAFQSVGTSFVFEITKIRMTKAADMLRADQVRSKQIGDIAHRCGFASQTYFSTSFRKYHGCSPSELRHR